MSKKNEKWCKRRHKVVMDILRPFFKLHFKTKYNLKIKTTHSPKGGAIFIGNHVTTLDMFYIGSSYYEPVYYMASVDLFEHAITGKLLRFLVNPIPKEKSKKSDLRAIRTCMKVANEGGNICIFIEGNRTLSGDLCNVDPSFVKLLKKLKKPLYIYNILGGYGTDPRWGNGIRKGKMEVKVKKELPYDEYKDMSDEDLYNLIITNLTVNNFTDEIKFKSKKRAECLERALYVCPICHEIGTLKSKNEHFGCLNCGLDVVYNENLSFTSNNSLFKFKHINEWYNFQTSFAKEMEKSINPNRDQTTDILIYKDPIKCFYPRLFKSKKKVGEGTMSLYYDRFEFKFKNRTLVINFNDIEAITLLGKKKMNIYYGDNITLQVFNDERTNLLKYMQMYYIIKNQREEKNYEFLGL